MHVPIVLSYGTSFPLKPLYFSLDHGCWGLLAANSRGGRVINPFRDKTFYLFVWRAWLVALVAVVLVVTRSVQPGFALLIGGTAALTFAVALVLLACWLSRDRVVLIEPWRMMDRAERPAGAAGRQWACNCMREIALQFAKAASAVAVTLLGCALLVGVQ